MERKEFKQTVKDNFLAVEKKYREIKKIATMSSNDPNFNMDKTSEAQAALVDSYYCNKYFGLPIYTTYTMWRYNCAWYIVKHNLDLPENQEKLFEYISQVYSHCEKHIGNPDFKCSSVEDYAYKELFEIINSLSNK